GLAAALPELPDAKKARFVEAFGLSPYDAGVLVMERDTADYFEEMVAEGAEAKASANWLINEYFGRLNKAGLSVDAGPITAKANSAIVQMISADVISGKIAKDLIEIVWNEGRAADPRAIVEARGMKQVTDSGAIEAAVDAIIAANPDKVAQAQAKPTMLGWFVGQVMKQTGGKANPQSVNDLLKSKLGI
ncbi:MAG: Asp-tRNA(Asn)/Glu-tRNA(Gln) amidotransferase subunit GatB, partial [Hyphomicrobiales bacterium]|nr:Asp-tRNA(Asn)/Glu-tRNA(Gln) amidotransferase subunit GatB [Hyphomicrobiales bacterium]